MADNLVDLREAADRLNLGVRQIHHLAGVGMPRQKMPDGSHRYPFPACFVWYLNYKIERAVAEITPADIDEARARKIAAEARLAEVELAVAEGRYLDKDVILAEWNEAVTTLRSQLLTLPQRWAHDLVGVGTIAEAVAVLERAVRESLETLADR
jgi:hypothetical protein